MNTYRNLLQQKLQLSQICIMNRPGIYIMLCNILYMEDDKIVFLYFDKLLLEIITSIF